VASEHPEFFRVTPIGTHRVSMVARHVAPEVEGRTPPLAPATLDSLMRAAIEMHDRQVRRAGRWKELLPLWTAVITGIFSLTAVFLAIYVKALAKP